VNSLDEVEYYDGLTPVAQKGKILFSKNFLKFVSNNGSTIRILYKDISKLENISGTCSVIIEDHLHTSKKLILKNKKTILALEKKHTNNLGVFKNFSQYIHKMQGTKLIVISLIVVPLASYLIFFSFSQAYKIIPVSYDKRIGDKSFGFIKNNNKVCENKRGLKALNVLKSKLTNDQNIEILIIDNEVVNALAFPGGRILLFNGLLKQAQTPEEVYAVLAHEVAHEDKRHSMQQLSRSMGAMFVSALVVGGTMEGIETLEKISEIINVVIFMKYSRGFEEEADQIAIARLIHQKASLKGMIDFFKRNSIPASSQEKNDKKEGKEFLEWLSTHPMNKKRIETIETALKNNKYKPVKLINQIEWKNLKDICN